MSFNLTNYSLKLNSNDIEFVLSAAEELTINGYSYAAFPVHKVCDADNVEFFRNSLDAREYCFVITSDSEYFKNMPTASLINDLRTVMQSGMHNLINEVFDLTAAAGQQRDKRELIDNNVKINIMNQKNLEFLKNQVKYTGFGETFDTELKEQMTKGENEFKLTREGVYGKDTMDAVLSFKKSGQTDNYFFNSYHVNLKKEDSKEGLGQTFYINKEGGNITLKEAYNLMEGRSVNKDLKNKEGEVYNSWIKIDFKDTDASGNFKLNHYHQNYGYDLEASVSKHSIKELNTPEYKDDLLNSLRKGNLQSATFVINGTESKQYIEANPQFKTVNIYDTNMQRINNRESKEQKSGENEKSSLKEDKKQSNSSDDDGPEIPKEGKKRRKSQSNSV